MDRVLTGFISIDEQIKISKGELVVISSRPACGKTCFLCSIIEKTLPSQKNVFFSMQTSKHKGVNRLKETFNKEFTLVSKLLDLYDLLLEVATINSKRKISAIFIDNLKELVSVSNIGAEKIILLLKSLAKRLNVAVFITDTLMYNGTKMPTYLDLKHKELLKFADKIFMLIKKEISAQNSVFEIMVNKNLEDFCSPFIELEFDKENYAFTEITKPS